MQINPRRQAPSINKSVNVNRIYINFYKLLQTHLGSVHLRKQDLYGTFVCEGKQIAKECNRDQSRQLRWISHCRLGTEGDSLLGRGKYAA